MYEEALHWSNDFQFYTATEQTFSLDTYIILGYTLGQCISISEKISACTLQTYGCSEKAKITYLLFEKKRGVLYVPLLFVSRQFVSLLLVFNNSSPLQFVSTTIRLRNFSSPLLFVSTTFRLHYYSSSHNSSPYYSSPTIRLHYYSSPLLFVSTTFRLHYFSSPDNSSPYDSSPTIRLHYFSSPQNSSPLLFGSITILLYIV